METIKLPFFGKISINKTLIEQDFQKYKKVNESFVEFNLNFEPKNTSLKDLQILEHFLEDFQRQMDKADNAISENYKQNGIAKEFVQIFVDALRPLAKEVILETLANGKSLEDYLFEDIELAQVYSFPDDDGEFIKFTYQITPELDEFLFIRFGKDLEVKEVGIEY